MKPVDQYLASYATAEIRIAKFLTSTYSQVVAIPCVDERAVFVEGLARAAARASGRVLAIIVVNGRSSADESVRKANRALIVRLRAMHRGHRDGIEVSEGPPAWLCDLEDLDLLVVDRASDGFHLPEGQGVGLARKIGCDIALALRARGQVTSRWLFMTDADAEPPVDYFRAAAAQDAAALVVPFWHVTDDSDEGRALALYDLSLRYYVLGLQWAGSSYAFHTVGSTIAVDYEAYAAVRGMPRRDAGEDFYLLNKIAKQGAVVRPRLAPILIAQRKSTRVPFGTGNATLKITAQLRDERPFCMYAPETFTLLRELLGGLDEVTAGRELRFSPALEPIAQRLGVMQAVASARTQTSTLPAMRRRMLEWFDAFRTLKFVHAVRDSTHPVVPWRRAISGSPFLPGCDGSESVDELRSCLFELEES